MQMNGYQHAFLETYPPTRVFAVVSWGCAGTAWIARMLNSHPDIFCVHAANTFWHVLGGAPRLDGVDYLRLIGSQGHAHRLAGDVHGISRAEVPNLKKVFDTYFSVAVVVRDPLPRLRSQLAHLERFGPYFSCEESHAQLLCERAGLVRDSVNHELLHKLHAINMLNAISEEIALGPIFQIETLASSPAEISRFIGILSGATLECTPDWTNKVILAPKVNSHAGKQHVPFSTYEMHLIQRMVTSEAWNIYRQLGYAGP